MKEELAERILKTVYHRQPEWRGRLTLKDTFSPLTFRDYTLAPTGSAYGLKKSVDTLYSSKLRAITRVKGLYIAGQSVILPGILGALISSIDACNAILGREYLIEQIIRETE